MLLKTLYTHLAKIPAHVAAILYYIIVEYKMNLKATAVLKTRRATPSRLGGKRIHAGDRQRAHL